MLPVFGLFRWPESFLAPLQRLGFSKKQRGVLGDVCLRLGAPPPRFEKPSFLKLNGQSILCFAAESIFDFFVLKNPKKAKTPF